MIEQNDLAELQATLDQLAHTFSEYELKVALTILQGNDENANFCQEVGKLRLDVLLLDLLQKYGERINLAQDTELIAAINCITYYSRPTSELISRNTDFIDCLRVKMEHLDMQSLESL